MRERGKILPTAPQRERWRRGEGLRAAERKALSGEMTPKQFESYAIDTLEIHTWTRPHLSQPHRPLRVKRFKPEFKDQHKHDPTPLTEHPIFPHAPVLDHHRAHTLSGEQKQARIQQSYDLYLSDRHTLTDYARNIVFFDKYGPRRPIDNLPTRIHHQSPSERATGVERSEAFIAPRMPLLQVIMDHLPAPIRALR